MTATWVIESARVHKEHLRFLAKLPPDRRVRCRVCGGSAPPACGCDGTMTVAAAIAYHQTQLEILAK
jgi:hypothetical protein